MHQTTSGFNYASTADNLSTRGIYFSENSPPNKAKSASFVDEWNLFAAECGVAVDADTAWKAFQPVMTYNATRLGLAIARF
jgi:hypothetical protein